MNVKPKKEEAPLQPTSPQNEVNTENNLTPTAKRVKLTPEGVNQTDVDAVLKRLAQMKKRLREDILFMGRYLKKMRDQIQHGRWEPFLKRTFPFSIKTANIWIRCFENKDSELAIADWDAFMRVMYGNEAKKLKAPRSWKSNGEGEEGEEGEDDFEQSGGEGLSGFFPDKEKSDFFDFRKVIAALEEKVFSGMTPEAKYRFITDLIHWLETKKKNLGIG